MSGIDRHLELLEDVQAKVAAMVRAEFSADERRGSLFGRRVADMLADEWGGQSIYVPKDVARRCLKRNVRLFDEFTGSNVAELARKYGLSEQRVYAVIKQERARRRARQLILPGVPEEGS